MIKLIKKWLTNFLRIGCIFVQGHSLSDFGCKCALGEVFGNVGHRDVKAVAEILDVQLLSTGCSEDHLGHWREVAEVDRHDVGMELLTYRRQVCHYCCLAACY